MTKLHFAIKKNHVGGLVDCAYPAPGEDPLAALVQAAFDDVKTDVKVTVSGVEMHLAAWEDPDHWEEDWRAAAGDVPVDEFIIGLLTAAIEGAS